MLYIRKALPQDLPTIRRIYHSAQERMIQNGNPNQWGRSFPPEELMRQDIAGGQSFLLCSDTGTVHGVFALCSGEESSYQVIENGHWLNDAPYMTLHRVASDGICHGLFPQMAAYAKSLCSSLRIDTHQSNYIMQKQIERAGFQRCGIIYVRDGSPRIAYQWVADSTLEK